MEGEVAKMMKIPLEILTLEDNSYHLLIDVLINDEIHGKMVVDTGASRTVIDATLAFAIDELKETPYTSGIGGQVDVTFTTLNSLALGNFLIEGVSLAMIDLSTVNEAYKQVSIEPIIGLLGSDLLLKYQAKIDYKEASLYLE
ncbi:aspartyl protease [Balneicella halophila]|uniref:Aspartyl protease n=1 Tax=Balneicella halophila TaxID=1537566 RepID=A0A7L4UMS3_BALHA|nr:retropepsin-like aspartic protease [Balneicella halophila]PVX49829.1 aspartyl protease [Balneicella halophila]